MDVSLLVVPYDSARESWRMGAGPIRLLKELEPRLRQAGHTPTPEIIKLQDPFPTEISSSFALNRQLAEQVRQAQNQGRFPLVLAGNCGASLGVVAGLPYQEVGIVWLDAHGDYNTPETSTSGFLDGMGLAVVTGQCWQPLACSVLGFKPVPPTRVLHIGGRNCDTLELAALQQAGIALVAPQQAGAPTFAAALAPLVTALAAQVKHCYVHIDLDVLDAELVGRANTYASTGGLTLVQVLAVVETLQQSLSISAVTFASYDPQADTEGHVLAAALRIAQQLLPSS
ncbi:arginase family protein [Hymenobacter sp. YC55]|uniref:arginase family protein n=1 Tax=Hymenobacter sp. YC55 TaxID=3034019 RepID=UPI0023F9AC50|nr:arginase family protein [Hymenobacter sp. YC55]MDF7814847.1 arginase family protein [Hymenobacter sp. YC55]